jgi:glutaredoxin
MQIQIYTKPDCPYCVKAKALLKELGLPFIEQTVGVDITSESYKNLYWPTVPCVIIDEELIGGYSELSDWAINNDFFG